MKKIAFCVVFFVFSILAAGKLSAAETSAETKPLKRILDVQGRGFVNMATCWGEMIRAYGKQKEAHPKAWPLTYFPYAFGNTLLRLGSGANDVAVLPFYVNATKNSTPITERLDLPEYYWKKN